MDNTVKHIISYDNDTLRAFINVIQKGYDDSKKVMIPYDIWYKRASSAITSSPKDFGTELIQPGLVRYTDTKTVYQQLKSIEREVASINMQLEEHPEDMAILSQKLFDLQYKTFTPLKEFEYPGYVEIDGNKAWYASTMRGVNVRIGPESLDLSKPTGFKLGDEKVHANIQGATASGKTTLASDIIFNLMLEHPPWELDLKLIDNKIAEFHLFARAAKAPHATVVAATKSKEFLLDLYSSFVEETNMRQEIFNATQTKDKRSFRQKFNLNLPEIVIIIDEYVAMLLAIEDSSALGNQKASEELHAIESVLLTLATQSRNSGIHFVISSQDLGSKLDANISKQIHVGAVLKGTSDIYNGCINNTEVNIDRKGICVMNEERMMKDNSGYNKIVGVPFIETGNISGELLNPAQKLLIKIADKSRELGFYKDFYFYDANAKISYSSFETELLRSVHEVEKSSGEILYRIPLGTAISYRNPKTTELIISNRKGDNILYYSRTENLSRYIIQIILKSILITRQNIRMNVYYTEPKVYTISEIDTLNINKTVERIKLIVPSQLETFLQRSKFIQIQELVFNRKGQWDLQELMQVVARMLPRNSIMDKYKNKCETDVITYLNGTKKPEDRQLLFGDIAKEDLTTFNSFILDCRMCCIIREQKHLNNSEKFLSTMFDPIVNVWFGLEDVDNLTEDWVREGLKEMFMGSTSVNILNVAHSGALFKIRKLLSGFNFVVEFANKSFWTEGDLPLSGFIVNINTDSIVAHDLRKDSHTITKIYGGI